MIKSNTPPPESITHKYIATLVRIFVLAAFLVVAVQTSVSAVDWRELSVVNKTGRTIYYLYISPNDDDWGHDLLGSSTLKDGYAYVIKYDSDAHFYNVKVVFSNGESQSFTGTNKIDLTRKYELRIFLDHAESTK